MGACLMVQDVAGRPPSPADRVKIAKELFERRFGRPPAAIYVHPSQLAPGASVAEAGVVPVGVVWCEI